MLTSPALALLAALAWRSPGAGTGPAPGADAPVLAPTTPPAPGDSPVTSSPGTSLTASELQARREQAYDLHDNGEYAAAATELELLYAASGGRADLLFEAGQSRFAAGHRAHALRHFQDYLRDPGLTPDDRALGESRAAAATAATTLLTIIVAPADAITAGTRITAHRSGDASPGRPPLSIQGAPLRDDGGLAYPLRLDPGSWQIVVQTPGAAPTRANVELVAGTPAQLRLTLAAPASAQPTQAPDLPSGPAAPRTPGPRVSTPASRSTVATPDLPRASTAQVAGLATGAALGVGVGVALTAVGARRFTSTFVPCPSEPGCSERAILADLRLTGAGSAILGAGLGLAVTTVATRFVRASAPWYAQLGLGGAMLLTGTIWSAVSNHRYRSFTGDALYERRIDGWLAGRSVGTAVLGLGAGLVLGSGVALLGQRRARTRNFTLAPIGGGGQFGLRLVGRF